MDQTTSAGGSGPSLVGTRVGPYEVLELIGRGGMGEVYRARDSRLDRIVAVKSIRGDLGADPQFKRRFRAEVAAASRVVHPYVATVFDVVERDDAMLLVMEHVEGRGLDALLRDGPLRGEPLRRLAAEIAEALGVVHRAGLVHRDLKPANVMLTAEGHVKVMDFGLASRGPDAAPEQASTLGTTQSAEGVVRGTPAYMAPEQLRGERPDPRSDLFSLGIVLYEAATGRHPFRRGSLAETISAILAEAPGPIETPAAEGLSSAILRLLDKDPARRFQTAEQLLETLRGSSVAQRAAFVPARFSLRSSRAARSALLVVFAVGAAWAGWWAWRHSGSGVEPPARPAIAVLPFSDQTAGSEGPHLGQMVADLVTAIVAESPAVRAVPFERVVDLDTSEPRASDEPARLARVRGSCGARVILTGTIYRENDVYHATAVVDDAEHRGDPRSFAVEGLKVAGLAHDLARKTLEIIGPDAFLVAGPETSFLTSKSEEAQGLYVRAQALMREERLDDARRVVGQALALDPDFLRARLLEARVLSAAGFERDAMERAESLRTRARAAGLPADSRLALEIDAAAASIRNQKTEAIAACERLVKRHGDEPDLWLELARALERDAKHAQALEALDSAERLDRTNPRVPLLRAAVLLAQGDLEGAGAALDEAQRLIALLDLPGVRPQLEDQHGRLFYKRREFGKARGAYARAVALYRDAGLEARALLALKSCADMDLVEWRLDEAAKTLEELLPIARRAGHFSLVSRVEGSLGGVYFRLRRLELAEEHSRAAVNGAIQLGDELLEVGPLINLASTLNLLQRVDEARVEATRALEIAQRSGDARRAVGARTCLAESDRRGGALTQAEAALREIGKCPGVEGLDRGWCITARQNLVHVLIDREDFPGAAVAAEAAVELARLGDDPRETGLSLLLLSRARSLAGAHSRARADLDEAGGLLGPAHVYPLFARARDLARATGFAAKGAWSELRAEPVPDRGVATVELIPLMLLRAEALARSAQPKPALKLIREALAHPWASPADRVAARLALARALQANGSGGDARREARAVAGEAERLGMHSTQASARRLAEGS